MFDEEKNLKQMLNLRSIGWSFYALAFKYNCREEIIKGLCDTYKPIPRRVTHSRGIKVFPKEESRPSVLVRRSKYESLLYERINKGKRYEDYLRDGK